MASARTLTDVTGHSFVELSIGYAGEVLTSQEAEKLIKELRSAIDTAARKNMKPKRFGDH